MEYCSHGTLEEAAKQGLPEVAIRRYTKDILTAIDVLHEHNVVHRDVKGYVSSHFTGTPNLSFIGKRGSVQEPPKISKFVFVSMYLCVCVYVCVWSAGCRSTASLVMRSC